MFLTQQSRLGRSLHAVQTRLRDLRAPVKLIFKVWR